MRNIELFLSKTPERKGNTHISTKPKTKKPVFHSVSSTPNLPKKWNPPAKPLPNPLPKTPLHTHYPAHLFNPRSQNPSKSHTSSSRGAASCARAPADPAGWPARRASARRALPSRPPGGSTAVAGRMGLEEMPPTGKRP